MDEESGQQKRWSYTIAEKMDGIKKLKQNNGLVSKTARELNVNNRVLRDWRDNKEKLANSSKKLSVRKIGCGRKAFFPELEKCVFKWLQSERIDHRRAVSYR
jgi:transposase-like protein